MTDETTYTTPEHVARLSAEFAATDSLPRMREIVVALARPGLTNKAGETEDFQKGLHRLAELAKEAEGDVRLEALALLARIRSQPSNALRRQIKAMLQEKGTRIRTAPSSLKNPQDREYLARSLRFAQFEGKDVYLATFVAGEGQGATKARNHALLALLASCKELETILNLLADALHETPISTLDVGTSRARRLTRTLDALEKALTAEETTVTANVGPALARLVELGLRRERVLDREAAVELATSALNVLSAIVRPNFSCAREPVIFDVVAPLRKLFLPSRWPEETLVARKALASVIRELIALLAPAGITDNRLRSLLSMLLDEATAETWLGSMARSLPGLSSEVRHWLLRGRALKSFATGEAASETILESIERELADACREARQLERLWSSFRDELVDAASEASAPLGRGVDVASDRINRLTRRLATLESRRGFEFEHEVGDAVEYVPAEHEAARPIEGVTMVRIVAPKVIRLSRMGTPQLILKAKVEPI